MINIEKLDYIIKKAKEVKQGVFSELTEEQKSAVLIFGDYFPVVSNSGVVKYDREGKYAALCPAYVKAKQVTQLSMERGFAASSYIIIMDEVPETIETSWEDAISSFPSNKIPPKVGSSLPLLQLEEEKPNPAVVGMFIGGILAKLGTGIGLTSNELAVLYQIQVNKDDAIVLLKKLNLYNEILFNTEGKYKKPNKEYTAKRGSWLANYITQIHFGKVLKADTEVE